MARLHRKTMRFFIFAFLPAVLALNHREPRGENSVLGCDGTTVELKCPEGQVISVFPHAIYGRFSLSECGNGDASLPTDCMQPNTIHVLNTRCLGRKECSLWIGSTLFDDPCPGVSKYLDASYECAIGVVLRCLGESRCEVAVSEKYFGLGMSPATCTGTPMYLDVSFNCSAHFTTTTAISTTTTLTTAVVEGEGIEIIEEGQSEEELQPMERLAASTTRPTCPATSHSHLNWPETAAGKIVSLPCPSGADGNAQWKCNSSSNWSSPAPSLTNCSSIWLRGVEKRAARLMADGPPASAPLFELSREMERETAKGIFPGDLPALLELMANVSLLYDNTTQDLSDNFNKFKKNMLSTSNHILSSPLVWKGWPEKERRLLASRLLTTTQRLFSAYTHPLYPQQFPDTTIDFYTMKNINVQLGSIKPSKLHMYSTVRYPSMSSAFTLFDTVSLPPEAFKHTTDVAYIYYANINNLQDHLTPKKQHGIETRVVSRILALSVFSHNREQKVEIIGRPVELVFSHQPSVVIGMSSARCAWWDQASFDWSTQGCTVYAHNDSKTICHCQHLTHFAVLMDAHEGQPLSVLDERILTFLTYAGCSLSIICLLLTLFALVLFSKGGGDRVFIHKNLCVSLATAELVFLTTIWMTSDTLRCRVYASLLLYLLLAALCWMLLEGVQLYFLLIDVFATKSRKGSFAIFAYGLPLLVLTTALAFSYEDFGTNQYCWIRKGSPAFLFFVLPAAIIMLANWMFLGMAVCVVWRHSSKGYLPCRHEGEGRKAKSWLKGCAAVAVLLGLSWSLGLVWMEWNSSTLIAYSFTVANSLQGLFIFLFHVVSCEKMRSDMRDWMNRHGCKGRENRSGSAEGVSRKAPGLSPSGESASEFVKTKSGTNRELIASGNRNKHPIDNSKKTHSSPLPSLHRFFDTVTKESNGVPYQAAPRQLYNHPNYVAQHALLQHQYSGGTYDYATIAYGEMEGEIRRSGVSGTLNPSPCSYSHPPPPPAPSCHPCHHNHFTYAPPPYMRPPYSCQPHQTSLYGTSHHAHRMPPEFDPPVPPVGTLQYSSRRPPSSKMSDDSAYSEASSMLTSELTPSGATVLRIDLKRNPPVYCQDL